MCERERKVERAREWAKDKEKNKGKSTFYKKMVALTKKQKRERGLFKENQLIIIYCIQYTLYSIQYCSIVGNKVRWSPMERERDKKETEREK